MFDRAGMKLGLDKAVMQRMNNKGSQDDAPSKNELNRKEIEDLLKKGAYGAVMDDEESAQFCAEDIDQILERRTTVIRHEGNEKGSIFSKATFSSSAAADGVELDDPDFWEKWAAKANVDTTEVQDENELIVYEPRRRRQVQRFGSRAADAAYESNDNDNDSDAYEDESEKSRKRDLPRPWTLSEKTKYERKLMIYGYGPWAQMQTHFPRRTEKDLKAATRYLMRKVLHVVEANSEEDRKLVEDIEFILDNDASDESGDETIPYAGASKKHIAEFRSFLIQAPQDYIEHIERKGRNFLLRIQMLHMVRDRIVPKDWEEAKAIKIPKVTGSLPCDWWREAEDRDLLLGICKHGYQQYLTMRKDKEFCFYGKKYDDSKAGTLQDDDDTDVKGEDVYVGNDTGDSTVYVWPSKADIGMRLRRIIAAFLREQGNDNRKRRGGPGSRSNGASGGRQRSRGVDSSNRWQKKHRGDFLRTVLSFGVETVPGDPNIRWDRFREISKLEKRTDSSLDVYYYKFVSACKEIMKKQKQSQEQGEEKSEADDHQSRESSEEASPEDLDLLVDTIPYDKARRALKRIDQMKKIREFVVVDPELDNALLKARKTSGLPP
jgi:hypothetical protein